MPVMTTYSRRLRRKTPELTNDILLHHIAPRLPAKSVLRLTAVCKEFYSFLKTHQFTKMHLGRVTNDHNHKFLVLSRDSEREGGWLFGSIDRETTIPSGVTRPSHSVPFLAPIMQVLSSFDGLLCVGIRQASIREYSDLILWNPTTCDYKVLCKTNVVIASFDGFGLYYTSSDDDYKLIHRTKRCEVYQYSLRFDSWRKLQVGFKSNFIDRCWWISSVWLNEYIYFLCDSFKHTIMRFDTITENLTVMKLPPPSGPPPFPFSLPCKRLFVHEGYIHLCVKFEGSFYRNVKFDTWRMNGDDGDWSMVDTYNMDKQDPLARRLKRRSRLMRNEESHLMRNGEWLIIHRPKISYRNHILYMFDQEKKAYTYIYAYTGLNNSMTIPEGGRYTETLVSPNQYVLP